MKAPTIPEGFQFFRVNRLAPVEIICLHPGCGESELFWDHEADEAKQFIETHKQLHKETT